MKKVIIFLVVAVVVLYAAYAFRPSLESLAPSEQAEEQTIEPVAQEAEEVSMENVTELQIEDITVGDGEEAVAGKTITVHYTGTLTDGTKFDSSKDRGTPFSFNLGAGQVIQGWDQGFEGMKVGGVRKLTIPPAMGYGASGAGPIPPNSTLIFEVELLGVE